MLRDVVASPTFIRIYLKTFFFLSMKWPFFRPDLPGNKRSPESIFFKQRSWGGDGDFIKRRLVWTDEQMKTENFLPDKNRSLPPYFFKTSSSESFFFFLIL